MGRKRQQWLSTKNSELLLLIFLNSAAHLLYHIFFCSHFFARSCATLIFICWPNRRCCVIYVRSGQVIYVAAPWILEGAFYGVTFLVVVVEDTNENRIKEELMQKTWREACVAGSNGQCDGDLLKGFLDDPLLFIGHQDEDLLKGVLDEQQSQF